MKLYKTVVICLLIAFFPTLIIGQIVHTPDPNMSLNQFLLNEKLESKQHLDKTNEIYIQQIGLENAVNSNLISPLTEVKLTQNGSLNNIDLNVTAKSYFTHINQNGDYNNVFENIYAPSSELSLNLSQNGSNNHFERYGSNSIGDKIEFNMNGNNKAILVMNFK